MILEILRRTPMWVYFLFAALIFLGYTQSRTRSVSAARLAILPVVMAAFSLYGVLSGFGASPAPVAAWACLLAVSAAGFAALDLSRGATYANGVFTVPGSWLPMAVILIIFFTRYAINVSLAISPGLRGVQPFAITVCALYGLASGFFAGRMLGLLRRARRTVLA